MEELHEQQHNKVSFTFFNHGCISVCYFDSEKHPVPTVLRGNFL